MKRVMVIGEQLVGLRLMARLQALDDIQIVAVNETLEKCLPRDETVMVEKWQQIPNVMEQCNIERVYLAMENPTEQQRQELEKWCREKQCELQTEPGRYEAESRKLHILQTAQDHMEKLLHRNMVCLPMDIQAAVRGKTVLVTGAGGTIGSEICRVLAMCQPKQLILNDISEHESLRIKKEVETALEQVTMAIGSVANDRFMRQLFETYHPQIVFHAAAHKHVPLMETNISQCIENNVFGTYCCAKEAIRTGAESFVLISTDKAAQPISVMGKAKRACEIMMRLLQEQSKTRLCSVRFGNVIGSSGSVLQEFAEQIAYGGPIVLTEEGMTRFFMTAREAAQLVISAAFSEQPAHMYMLDMGEPVSISELAKRLLHLLGKEEIPMVHIGRRKGEKLTEQLYTENETVQSDQTSHIYAIQDRTAFDHERWFAVLKELRVTLFQDEERAKQLLQQLLDGNEETVECV